MSEKAFQIDNGLYQMFLAITKEYGFEFANSLIIWEIPIIYADWYNKVSFANPESDQKGNLKPVIYKYLKP